MFTVFRQAHYLYLSSSLFFQALLYSVQSFSSISVYNEIYQKWTMSNKVYNSSIVNIYHYSTRINGMKGIQRSILPTKHPDRDTIFKFRDTMMIGWFKKSHCDTILYTHFGSIAAPELTVQWEKVRYSSPPKM